MIRVSGLKINISHTDEDIKRAIQKKIRSKNAGAIHFRIHKKSLDARDKNNIHWNYCVDFTTENEKDVRKRVKGRPEFSIPQSDGYLMPSKGHIPYDPNLHGRICVVGSGPAGLFAAYLLAENGYQPLLIERGEPVEDRMKTVERLWNGEGDLDPDSNIQFGEGGAGTFSDGKLNTGNHDPSGRIDLMRSVFVKHGAPEHILYDSKPHIGSDVLINVIRNMRSYILEKGGEILFRTKFVELNYSKNQNSNTFSSSGQIEPLNTPSFFGNLESIVVEDLVSGQKKTLPCHFLVLAIGHSARDTFRYIIEETPLETEAKPFAVGIRIQHQQEMINRSQYGDLYRERYQDLLPPADYKLVRHSDTGETVYSFCMCPGGYVVNSSSEPGKLCINGMSYSGRAGSNANAAIVVGVKPSSQPLENIRYQQELETRAFQAADGKIPVQLFRDFESSRISDSFGSVLPQFKGQYAFADLNKVLDAKTCDLLKESIHEFGKKIQGFDAPDALLSAVESRTSSPVRILRNKDLEACIRGVYPCGEGAGYAGGITSAAVDGIKVFESICKKINSFVDYQDYL